MSAVHKHFTQQQLFVALYLTKRTRGPLDRLRKDPTALQRSAGHREDFRISFPYLISTPKGKPMRGLHRSGNTMPRLSFPGSRQAAGLTASSSAFRLVVTEPLAPNNLYINSHLYKLFDPAFVQPYPMHGSKSLIATLPLERSMRLKPSQSRRPKTRRAATSMSARHCDGESGLEAVEPTIAAAPKMPRSRGLRL